MMEHERWWYRITKPWEQPTNTRWNAACFDIGMLCLFTAGVFLLQIVFHAVGEKCKNLYGTLAVVYYWHALDAFVVERMQWHNLDTLEHAMERMFRSTCFAHNSIGTHAMELMSCSTTSAMQKVWLCMQWSGHGGTHKTNCHSKDESVGGQAFGGSGTSLYSCTSANQANLHISVFLYVLMSVRPVQFSTLSMGFAKQMERKQNVGGT